MSFLYSLRTQAWKLMIDWIRVAVLTARPMNRVVVDSAIGQIKTIRSSRGDEWGSPQEDLKVCLIDVPSISIVPNPVRENREEQTINSWEKATQRRRFHQGSAKVGQNYIPLFMFLIMSFYGFNELLRRSYDYFREFLVPCAVEEFPFPDVVGPSRDFLVRKFW